MAVDITTDVAAWVLSLVFVWCLSMPFGMDSQVVAAFRASLQLVTTTTPLFQQVMIA